MNENNLLNSLYALNAPSSDEIRELFKELYNLEEEHQMLVKMMANEEIYAKIKKIEGKIQHLEAKNQQYAEKSKAITEILGLIVLKSQKGQYSVFKRRNDMFKNLLKDIKKRSSNYTDLLKERPKNIASRKALPPEMADAVKRVISLQRDLDEKKIEKRYFNEERNANCFALLDEVKDLYTVCTRQGMSVTELNQADIVRRILG